MKARPHGPDHGADEPPLERDPAPRVCGAWAMNVRTPHPFRHGELYGGALPARRGLNDGQSGLNRRCES